MLTANLTSSPLYAKGTMDVKMFDPATNNLVYYSNKMATSQLQSTINLAPVNAGPGNPVVIQLPDTPSLTMNLTAADFSLEGRALSVGGTVTYNGIVPVDEVVEAAGTTLTVAQTPVAPLGGCDVIGYVGNSGKAYKIDPETRVVEGFAAEAGTKYCVHYYTASAGAQQFSVETLMSPAVVRTLISIPLYASQSPDAQTNSLTGTRVGTVYITIPRMQLNGDISTEASQTTAATTVMSGTALSYDEACEAGLTESCGTSAASPKLAYMVQELFGSPEQFVTELVLIGGNDVTLEAGKTFTLPVKYVMDDGSLGQPLMSNLKFTSAADAIATVSPQGVVTGLGSGTTAITVAGTGTKGLSVTANVTVTGGVTVSPTADVDFALTEPAPDGDNSITGGGADKAVAVSVAEGTASVVLTAAKTAGQTVTVGGTDAASVTAGGTGTAPTYTVDTSGGSKSFDLTVSESGKTPITYTVTVTVAAA